MASGLIVEYFGQGLAANRPTTPNVPAGGIALYFSTDSASGAQLTVKGTL